MVVTGKPDKEKEEIALAFLDIAGIDIVDIYVGPEKKLFRVHKAILCNKVPYFKAMFGSGFKEALENKADLPDDTPESFDLLVDWIYSGTLRALTTIQQTTGITASWNVVDFYCLANKISLPRLEDQIMNMFIDFQSTTNSVYPLASVKWVYRVTPEGCSLRRYLTRRLHHLFLMPHPADRNIFSTSDVQSMMAECTDLGVDFLNLVRDQPIGVPVPDPRILPKCDFHSHGKDEDCPSKMTNQGWLGANTLRW